MVLRPEKREKQQPKRIEHAIKKLSCNEYVKDLQIIPLATITFTYRGSMVYFYPYTGWHSGKTIRDGRGLKNLLKQLM